MMMVTYWAAASLLVSEVLLLSSGSLVAAQRANHGQQQIFSASFGAMGGVPARPYQFQIATASSTSGSYADRMIEACEKGADAAGPPLLSR